MSAAPPGPKRQAVLRVIGILLTGVGAAGIFLPLLPGVPFLILAAACFARSSPRLEKWLLNHPLLGPGVRKWRERGAISLKSKILALTMMAASAFLVLNSGAPRAAQIATLALMGVGAAFVATRPND